MFKHPHWSAWTSVIPRPYFIHNVRTYGIYRSWEGTTLLYMSLTEKAVFKVPFSMFKWTIYQRGTPLFMSILGYGVVWGSMGCLWASWSLDLDLDIAIDILLYEINYVPRSGEAGIALMVIYVCLTSATPHGTEWRHRIQHWIGS